MLKFFLSVDEILGSERFAPAVARFLLRLVLRRVIHKRQVTQVFPADDGVCAHARPAAIQAFRADAARSRCPPIESYFRIADIRISWSMASLCSASAA